MCSHKSDEYMPDCELHYHYQTILVSPDVKDIMLVTNIVCRREVRLYLRQILPLCLLSDVIPSFKCSQSVFMSFRTVELN